MFNLQNLIQQIIYRTLVLAIIFCLSGIANVVCCIAKCEIVIEVFSTAQTTDSSCHKNETVSLIAESGISCCVKQSCEESTDDLSLETISLEEVDNDCEESEPDGYSKDSSCKMICCLPSEEVVDITPIPRLDGTIAVNYLQLVSSNITTKSKTHLLWPVQNLPSQEKTYLRCCVFLI